MMNNLNDEDNVYDSEYFHYQWHKITSISYINIIDYKGKRQAFESEPWSEIPMTEEDILKSCQSNIYDDYIKYLLSKIVVSNHSTILKFLQKMLQ
ncbi:hypothetical protein TNIN_14091 [Trichonephila inaurata madagascariensis]|uniref:Uncharacterized protein n=1 Tax=Trichonephila inaurata madagascariensis TaxID=2747483 RepID=A0A8X6XGT1_9ARAC|nr:hypothetical protein TNIN_14091 [Trichonephila inaurata madagascariensis]